VSEKEFASGLSVITHEDIRWKRCDIKSLNLLASSFVNQKAKDFGFDDAVFVRDGFITEATYANVFIVDSSGTLITRMTDDLMLAGITRKRIIQLAKKDGFEVVEKNFSVSELKNASEAFLTSSSLLIRPVLKVDNEVIFGQRKKTDFSVAKRLKQLYDNFLSC
jgi:D-alanine transaminase